MFKACLIFTLAFGTDATSAYSCSEIFRSAVIPVNENAEKSVREYPTGGKQASPNDLNDLRPDRYLYVIDELGRLFWGTLIPDYSIDYKSTDPVFISHRSLIRKVLEEAGRIEFVGAGEFVVVTYRGQRFVQEVNNRSNTLPGTRKNLDISKQILASFGLVYTANTKFLDYSDDNVKIDRHLTQEEIALAILRFRPADDFLKFQEFVEKLTEMYPSKEKIGAIDSTDLRGALLRVYNEQIADDEVSDNLWQLYDLLPKLNTWGPEAVYKRLVVDYGKNTNDVVRILEEANILRP